MILKNIKESLKTVVSSISSITDRALLFNIMLPNGACFWRLPISAFFQEKFDRAEVPDMPSTNFNCGIVLVIILVFIALVF